MNTPNYAHINAEHLPRNFTNYEQAPYNIESHLDQRIEKEMHKSRNIPGDLSQRLQELSKAGNPKTVAIDKIFGEITDEVKKKSAHIKETKVANGITTLKEYFKFYAAHKDSASRESLKDIEMSMAELNVLIMGYTTSDQSRRQVGKHLRLVIKSIDAVEPDELFEKLDKTVDELPLLTARGHDSSHRVRQVRELLANLDPRKNQDRVLG